MTDKKAPKVKAHSRQILICMDGDCAGKSNAKAIKKAFKKQLRAAEKQVDIGHSLCTGMACIGTCKRGPIVVVWPDGVWYHSVDEAAVERIVNEHIVCGYPVEDFIMYRVPTYNHKNEDYLLPMA